MSPDRGSILIEFDARLVEEAVLLAMASRPGTSYWPAREACYRIADEEERERAFVALAREHFAAQGLARPLEAALGEQPLIAGAVGSCRVLRATGKGGSGAELFLAPAVSPAEKRLVLRVAPSHFLDPAGLLRFLRHELEHVADMLDPSFGYDPGLPEVDGGPLRLRLILERYRVLWSTSIDGRLSRRGQAPPPCREAWRRQFDATFGMLGDHAEAAFRRYFDGPRPAHAEMLRFACEPGTATGGGAGLDVCPLCRCLGHSASGASRSLAESVAAAVRADFPDWKPEAGICRQCADLYGARCGRGNAVANGAVTS